MNQPNNSFSSIHAVSNRPFIAGNPRWHPTGIRKSARSGFGRRRFQAAWLLLFLLPGLAGVMSVAAASPATLQAQTNALTTEMNDAIQQVQKIINQPVTQLARKPQMQVAEFQPGWFHEGATKPDFNTVDVRTTQEKIYDKHGYVSSDLNPGVVFLGRELEFNAMTKYFYLDRSLPKKKLTEPEMLEINRLYRIVGRCEQELAKLQDAETASESISPLMQYFKSTKVRVALVVVLVLGVFFLFRKRSE